MQFKLNKISVVFENYKHLLRGLPKSGKSTLYRDLVLEVYGTPLASLTISPSNETGYKAIDNFQVEEAPTWDSFVELVDELVDNRKEHAEIKMVCIDTIDALVEIATDRVMQIHFNRKGERAVSLNAALNGYGSGHAMVSELINDQVKRLESAGYGIFFIGHCKLKNITDPETGLAFDQVVGNLESRFDGIFINKADIVCTLATSREIKDEKLVGTSRYLYFRPNSFVDAGGRLQGMPERVSYGPKEYMKAFEQGVKNSFSTKTPEETIEKLREEEKTEIKEKVEKFVEKTETTKTQKADLSHQEKLNVLIEQIDEKIKGMNPDQKSEMKKKLKEEGIPTSYKTITDLEVLQQFLAVLG